MACATAAGSSATVALVFRAHGQAVATVDENFRGADYLGAGKPPEGRMDRIPANRRPRASVEERVRQIASRHVKARHPLRAKGNPRPRIARHRTSSARYAQTGPVLEVR